MEEIARERQGRGEYVALVQTLTKLSNHGLPGSNKLARPNGNNARETLKSYLAGAHFRASDDTCSSRDEPVGSEMESSKSDAKQQMEDQIKRQEKKKDDMDKLIERTRQLVIARKNANNEIGKSEKLVGSIWLLYICRLN